jgi:hypothetical protein
VFLVTSLSFGFFVALRQLMIYSFVVLEFNCHDDDLPISSTDVCLRSTLSLSGNQDNF